MNNRRFILKMFLVLSLTAVLYAFGTGRNNSRVLADTRVNFTAGDNFYIAAETVDKLLKQNFDSVSGVRKELLDLEGIERQIDSHPMIDKAEVYVTVDGILGARIKQRKPIARVVGATSFYIDEKGEDMPLSELYSPRVLLVTGHTEVDRPALTALLLEVREDEFMNNHITGLQVGENGDIRFSIRRYNLAVDFGQPDETGWKFQNFKAFYQKTIKDSLIDGYSRVDLRFDDQVVATKK